MASSRSQDEFRPVQRGDLVVREGRNGATVHDPLRSSTHRLNSTALEIWKQCDGSHRASDIAARLAKLFELSLADAQQHVDRMIGELRALDMIVTDEAAISQIPFES